MREQITNFCNRDDLRVEITATALVSGEGEPRLDAIENGDARECTQPYFCVGPCGQDFGDWDDAIAHLLAGATV